MIRITESPIETKTGTFRYTSKALTPHQPLRLCSEDVGVSLCMSDIFNIKFYLPPVKTYYVELQNPINKETPVSLNTFHCKFLPALI
jgi:hypothetical protein